MWLPLLGIDESGSTLCEKPCTDEFFESRRGYACRGSAGPEPAQLKAAIDGDQPKQHVAGDVKEAEAMVRVFEKSCGL